MKIPSLDKKILASAFSNKKSAMDVTDSTTHSYFYPDVQWLRLALEQYFTDPNIKTIPTRDMIAEYVGEDNAEKHLKLYDEIVSTECNEDEFGWLMEKLRFRYNDKVQKDTNEKVKELQNLPVSKERVDEINTLLRKSVVEIDSIHKKSVYKEGSLKNSASSRAKGYEYLEAHPESAKGVLSGWSSFDKITNGLHPGEFMIIAGDTGGGKSILMHNYAVNAYLGDNDVFSLPETWDVTKGKNVLFFSLEMPKEVIERRIDACISDIYSTHIRDGLLSEEDKSKYFRGLKFQSEYKKDLYIVDMPKNVTTREIELKYIEVCELGIKPDLVVIDYLGVMKPNDQSTSDWMDLGIISAELHEFARVYEVPVLTGSQVNKTKDGGERYDTNRIARSGVIPTNANIIVQIACRGDEDLRTDLVIHITKMRDGEKGHFTLVKNFAKMKVVDLLEESFNDEVDDLV